MGVSLDMLFEEVRSLREAVDRGEKEFLNIEDMAKLTGFSKSYIYKLTSRKKIPFYRPAGGKIFFRRDEIKDWINQSRICSESEIASRSASLMADKAFRRIKKC